MHLKKAQSISVEINNCATCLKQLLPDCKISTEILMGTLPAVRTDYNNLCFVGNIKMIKIKKKIQIILKKKLYRFCSLHNYLHKSARLW